MSNAAKKQAATRYVMSNETSSCGMRGGKTHAASRPSIRPEYSHWLLVQLLEVRASDKERKMFWVERN
jgi:hypothetical protein